MEGDARPAAFEHVNLLDDMEEYPEAHRIFQVAQDFFESEDKWTYQIYGFLYMKEKKVYGCHHDAGFIVHFPVRTNPKCKMIIEDEQIHIPVGTTMLVNSVRLHTACNLSNEGRIHLTYVPGPNTKERIIDKYFPLNRTLPPFIPIGTGRY